MSASTEEKGLPLIPPPLPPRPRPKVPLSKKDVDSDAAPPRRSCLRFPNTRRGRLIFAAWIAALFLVLVIVVAVCAIVIPKKSSDRSTGTVDNGGNPLPVSEGGVNIGQPGDIAKFGNRSGDHFVFSSFHSAFVTRLDPIVNPGGLGGHLHRISGSNYFTPNLISATDAQTLANCSTLPIQDDKSLYWVPELYYRYTNGSYRTVTLGRHNFYYFFKAPTGVPIYPFPDNYNMVAGNPYRRWADPQDPFYGAAWYQCFRGPGKDIMSKGFPNAKCGGLVMVVQFPSCWDGIYASDGNYTGHVSYPDDGANGYYCPKEFPKKFVTLQFEAHWLTSDVPYNGDGQITYVLSNGDTTGYGIHADFMFGWKPDTFDKVVTDCRYMNQTVKGTDYTDVSNCPILAKSYDDAGGRACLGQTPVVDEVVGAISPITQLPGCNALWVGNVSKPGCPPGTIDGGTVKLVQPTVWLNQTGYVG